MLVVVLNRLIYVNNLISQRMGIKIPARILEVSRMCWASGLRLEAGLLSEEVSDTVDTKTRERS